MSMDLNKGAFAQLGPMYDQLLSMTPDQIMQAGAPEFLKIAAMQQQGRARQAMQPPTPPLPTTVAQDVVQSVAPTGIGALPTSSIVSGPTLAAAPAPTAQMASGGLVDLETSPDMFNDRYYAEGGIVAFQKGGVPEDYISRGAITSEKYDPEIAYIDPRIAFPRTKEEFEARRKFEVNRARMARGEIPPIVTGAALGAGKPGALPPQVTVKPLETQEKEKADTAKSPTGDLEISELPEEFIPSIDSLRSGIGNVNITAPEIKYTPYEPPPEKSRETFLSEFGEDLKAAGVDREALGARQRERIGKLEEQFKKESAQAPGIALMELGLTMASTPGSFGQAITAGAQAGLTSYLRAKKDLKADERELLKMQDALDEAEYARKMEDVTAYRQYRNKAEEARTRAAEINFSKRLDVEQFNKEKKFEAKKAALAEQGRREELAALHAYRAADLAKDYATMQATVGTARMKSMADLAKAASKGAMTQQQILEELTKQAEAVKESPEFKNMVKAREGMTEEEINAEAFKQAKINFSGVQIIINQLELMDKVLKGVPQGGIGSLDGFKLTPDSTK